ncbi:MAG: cytochrome P460 family protein [Nitrospirales bacterium]|nr:cytochrome P460 family protein [Nitrospira sp.]MDR4501842.1 cytochrome P460 family protein [Nitrospirales bacterium]
MSMTPAVQSEGMPQDGELTFPTNYTSFPIFLKGIQKPDAVRDLYINTTGAEAHHGEPFANGSILVMAIFNAKKGANGEFEKDTQGNLMKDGLAKIFVMQKGQGWGMHAPDGLKNGDWIFSAFKPNGDRLDVDYTACRGCHLPLGDAKDYVHRYDEYFEKRGHSH